MSNYTFRVDLCGLVDKDCFKEASREELKVLLAIISSSSEAISADRLSKMIGVSRARVIASIALFEEAGVIFKTDPSLAEVVYEFDPKGESDAGAASTARSIRDFDLYEMNVEIEKIFEKTLETRETERIVSLNVKKGLSPEYILTLAAHLKDSYRALSAERVVREANKLIGMGIDTLEELEIYIEKKREEIAGEMEMRRLFGIYGRTLTKSEREHFNRWMNEYGYSSVIIGEAYDVTVGAIGKMSLSYINSILTSWHDSGCKTLEECKAKVNVKKHNNTQKANNSSQKSKKSAEAEVPKYAQFNSEDALMRAIERSYAADGEDER